MQTHKDIWFSVSDEHEHIYFRAYHKPTPVLDFIPWPIRVKGIVFSDGSELHSAHGSPAFFAGPGISITQTPGDPDIYTISNTQLQTPWQSDIDGAGFSLRNAFSVDLSSGSGGSVSLDPRGTIQLIGTNAQCRFTMQGLYQCQIQMATTGISATANITFNAAPNPTLQLFVSPNGIVTIQDSSFGPTLNVNGDVNTSGCYLINAIPFACSDGAGGVDLSNISTINGAAPGSQTPWLSDIDGNRFELTNVEYINANTDISANDFSINGIEFALAGAGPSEVALINISTINGAPVGLIGSYNPQAHDVTGIRTAITQYGPFPQARFVSVFFELIGASDNAFLNLILPGDVTATTVAGAGTGAEPQTGFLFGLVPAGAIYVVDTAMAITTWVEYY